MNTVEKHIAEAKALLLESGFVSDFHNILDVMNGNRHLKRVAPECATRRWGWSVLDNKLNFLQWKYPDYRRALSNESVYYFEVLSKTHNDVMDKIIDNKSEPKEEGPKEEEPKRPTIAIDVDGVLRDNLELMVDMYNKEFGQDLKTSDIKEFKTEKSFPLIQAETGMTSSHWFFNLHAKELFLDAPSYPNVAEDIKRLQEVADIVIITYQKDYTNKNLTLQWLEKNGIEPNGICFLRDKTIVHCDALIDDNDWNFIGTHVRTSVLVDAPYNQHIDTSDFLKKTNSNKMVRVSSLHDFVEKYISGEIEI